MGVVIVAVARALLDFNQHIFCVLTSASCAAHLWLRLSRCYSFSSGPCGQGIGNNGVKVNEFSGVVTDIREESRVAGRQRWQMALDRTEFVAGDVGMLEAVARSGAKLVVPVLGVV